MDEITTRDYQLQVGRWGENWNTYITSDKPETLVELFENEEEGGLSYDGKSNGKNHFRILDPSGNVIHEWLPLPYEGYPFIDLYAANPLDVIAEAYELEVDEMRRLCQQYLDATNG